MALKTPNNDAVTKLAAIIVSKEVTRLLGPDGAHALMKIGALLQLVHPLYRQYYDLVDQGAIQLETVQHYFGPEAWAKMTTPKRVLLEAAIRKEVEGVKKQIHTHMLYLHRHESDLATLGPAAQQELELVRRELLGEA